MTNDEIKRETEVRMEDYRLSCNRLADLFCEKYEFFKIGESDTTSWVADEPGGVLCVAQFTFPMSEIIDALQYDMDIRSLMRYYDYCLETYANDDTPMNIRTWYKLNQ